MHFISEKVFVLVVLAYLATFPSSCGSSADEGSRGTDTLGDTTADVTGSDTRDTTVSDTHLASDPQDSYQQDSARDAIVQEIVADATDVRSEEDTPEAVDSPPWPDDKYIGVDEVYRRVQAGDPDMLLLNVSDEEFYYLGHIEGSITIPWDELEARLNEVDRAGHIVVYCRRGVRSEAAYSTLMDAQYELVWVMEGGLEVWIELDYPTVP